MATATAEPSASRDGEQQGLKANAIGFVDALVIGLASFHKLLNVSGVPVLVVPSPRRTYGR